MSRTCPIASALQPGQRAQVAAGAATLELLRLLDRLHTAGQTLVIVTHDSRLAATADRLVSMRDGAFVDETPMSGGTRGNLGALARLEG